MAIQLIERLEGRLLMASVAEFSLASGSNPYGITSGPDDALWFTEPGTNNIGRITTGGTVTEFSIPTANSNPQNITTGPDDNLWFTENGSDKIGEVTTSGVFTEYSLASGSQPNEITAGPNGNIWFTETGSNKIGEIVPSGQFAGTITEFSLAADSAPWGITSGPDGNVWFTENGADMVGEIVPSGQFAGTISTYSLSRDAGPRGITTGPDGNLWFVEEGGTSIGRVTTGGSVTEFATPDGDHPNDIVAGPGGNLYYTPFYTDDIGVVSTAGFFSSYPIPTSTSRTIGITEGPDNHIWFAEANSNKIGSLALAASSTLSVSNATGIYGGTTTLTATLTSGGTQVDGGIVDFHLGATDLGTSTTDTNGIATIDLAPFGSLNVGTYAGDITASFLGNADFASSDGSADLVVTPAPLTIRAADQSKVYGQANPTPTYTISGVLGQDDVTPVFADMASQYSDVSADGYGIAFLGLTGADAGNYSVSTEDGGSETDGTLTITPAPLSVVVADQSKVYGQANPTPTGLLYGLLDGDSVGLLYRTTATQFSDVQAGGYAILPVGLTGPKAIDYSYNIPGATITDGTLTITPAPLAVAVKDLTKVYGQADSTLTATVAGILNGDDVTAQLATSATTTSNVVPGGYAINLTGLSGSKVGDYNLTASTPGTLTITPAPLTIVANPASKLYGQAIPTLSSSYRGFVLGQGPSDLTGNLEMGTTATSASDVGIYGIVPAGQSSTNYAITYNFAPLANYRAPLIISAPNVGTVYGQDVPSLAVSYSGFVNGDTPASLTTLPTLTTSASSTSHVGLYTVTASGADSGNYAIGYLGGSVAVIPATLTVTANPKTDSVVGLQSSFSGTYSGFVNGDTEANLTSLAQYITPIDSSTPAGIYPIIPVGGSSPDYTFVRLPAPFVYEPAGSVAISLANIPAPQLAFLTSLTTSVLGQVPNPEVVVSFALELDMGTTREALARQLYQSADAMTYRAGHRNALSLARALAKAQAAQTSVVV